MHQARRALLKRARRAVNKDNFRRGERGETRAGASGLRCFARKRYCLMRKLNSTVRCSLGRAAQGASPAECTKPAAPFIRARRAFFYLHGNSSRRQKSVRRLRMYRQVRIAPIRHRLLFPFRGLFHSFPNRRQTPSNLHLHPKFQ